jgi:pyruvate dehydrogenase E2 component (dihydrolipoamide acetyltransferase)
MAEAILPITMPKWGIEMTEGTITAWTAAEGQELKRGDALLEVETDKIVNTVEAPLAGRLQRIVVPQGEVRAVGELIAVFATVDVSDADVDAFIAAFVPTNVQPTVTSAAATGLETIHEEAAPAAARPAPSTVPAQSAALPPGEARVSPSTRRLAGQLGVDLSQVPGTGRNGRISAEDVEAYAALMAAGSANPVTRVKMSATRTTIARRLLESKQTIPHYRLAIEVQAGALLERKRALTTQAGMNITLNDLLLRACALALVRHPQVNARLEGEEILQYAHADIAIAVATPDGLITPVVRHADTRTAAEVAQETAALVERARAGRLTREEISGGTFTVSNLGMFGLDRFDAIINPPQVAILAAGGISERLIARDGAPVVAPVMTLTLSADHRVVDGAVAAAFLATLRDELQTPVAL